MSRKNDQNKRNRFNEKKSDKDILPSSILDLVIFLLRNKKNLVFSILLVFPSMKGLADTELKMPDILTKVIFEQKQKLFFWNHSDLRRTTSSLVVRSTFYLINDHERRRSEEAWNHWGLLKIAYFIVYIIVRLFWLGEMNRFKKFSEQPSISTWATWVSFHGISLFAYINYWPFYIMFNIISIRPYKNNHFSQRIRHQNSSIRQNRPSLER